MRRSGAAAGHQGYVHEAARFGSAQELVDIAVPFLLDGVAAGEPTVVAVDDDNAAAIRAALPEQSGIDFVTSQSVYTRPAPTISAYRRLLAEQVSAGAGQIRILGELSSAGRGATWDWWTRYEAAINRAYDEFPLWSICAYDVRTTPQPVLDDVARTHPRLATPGGGHASSPDYQAPEAFLGRRPPIVPDPSSTARRCSTCSTRTWPRCATPSGRPTAPTSAGTPSRT